MIIIILSLYLPRVFLSSLPPEWHFLYVIWYYLCVLLMYLWFSPLLDCEMLGISSYVFSNSTAFKEVYSRHSIKVLLK